MLSQTPDMSRLEPIENVQPRYIPTLVGTKNPLLRTILPSPLSTGSDILRQFNQPGIPQFRFAGVK